MLFSFLGDSDHSLPFATLATQTLSTIPAQHLERRLIYRFDTNGRLIAILDRNNNQTTITRDANNRIIAVSDAAGRTLNFNWSGPFVQSISDSTGTIATYTYWSATDQL